MESKDFICHDLKTDPPDVSQGLPSALKLVPILFYLVGVASIILGAWFAISMKTATESKKYWSGEISRLKRDNERLAAETADIEKQNGRAREVVEWMEGAQGVQPLSVAVTRSLAPSVTLSELSLTRNAEIPNQLYFTLKLDGAGPDQLEQTLTGIRAMNFQDYSAQQVKTDDLLDYKATLIWQNPN
ncbi:MAG: hypothetical protein AAGD22_11325 [Verrucomicrobiota bacterium]